MINKHTITTDEWNNVNNSMSRNVGDQYSNRDASFGGTNPKNNGDYDSNDYNDPLYKLRQKYVPLGNIYQHENMCLELIDVSTGERINDNIYSISDSIRLARSGDKGYKDESIVYHNFIPDDPLSSLKYTNEFHYNVRSSIEALGLYISTLIKYQVKHLGDKNSDLGQVEDISVASDITFRNYIYGGASPRNPTSNKAVPLFEFRDYEDEANKDKTLTEDLGIGLGHCAVLNPVFQFNKRDDVRTNPMYTHIGRVYSTQIMNNWPVVLLQPGRLKYNTGFFKFLGLGGGAGAAEHYIRNGGEGIGAKFSEFLLNAKDVINVLGTIGSAIFGGHKLVEFRDASNMFKMYSRSLYISLSEIMGLWTQNAKGKHVYCGAVPVLDITHILPTLNLNGGDGLSRYTNNQYIPFRCQKGCVGNETFTNNTESNPLMEEMNATATENSEEGKNQNSFFDTLKQKGLNFLGNFSDKAAVLSGQGRITLPDVYASSQFQRSLTLGFEFHYPYGDVLGKFENTLLQFLTLLTMGLARQTGKLTYTSPFAVRLYIKNHIFINYGMIESITVTRGGDDNDWGADGFPKTLKVDLSIKDMEPNISLPLASRGPFKMALEVMFPTSGISEYLGSIGGISLDEMTHTFRKGRLKRAMNTFKSSWNTKYNWDNMMATVANTHIGQNIIGMFYTSEIDQMNKVGDMGGMLSSMTKNNTMNSKYSRPYLYGSAITGQMQAVFDNSPAGAGNSGLTTIEAEQADTFNGLNAIAEECQQNWGFDR